MVLAAGCASSQQTYFLVELPRGMCTSVDASPGPFWHAAQEFTVCRDDDGRYWSPTLLGNSNGDIFSQAVGPLGAIANRIEIPVPMVTP